jgi:ADP-ribose pyrophosphatase
MPELLIPPTFGHRDVQIETREKIFGGFCNIERVQLRHRHFACHTFGPSLKRELVIRRPAVGVLIHDPNQRTFVLIEQFRIGAIHDTLSPWQLEVVAGLIDDGESPEQAAIREAFEETGIHIAALKPLHQFYPSAGGCDEHFTLYAATADLRGAGGIHGAMDEGENIRVHIVECDTISALLRSGRLVNAPVIIALQWLHTQYGTPQEG